MRCGCRSTACCGPPSAFRPAVVTIVSLFYAPLTEEPAKWLTAAVPKVRQAIRKDPIFLALAAGAGFGVGEIWFLAHALIKSPSYPDLPFWMFGGFLYRAPGGLLPARRVADPAVLRARHRPFVPARRIGRDGAAFPAQLPDLSRLDRCSSASARPGSRCCCCGSFCSSCSARSSRSRCRDGRVAAKSKPHNSLESSAS